MALLLHVYISSEHLTNVAERETQMYVTCFTLPCYHLAIHIEA